MSTTDILLTDILNGLSPPSMLTDINKSIIALQGKLTEVIGKLNTDLTDAVGKVTDAVGKVTDAVGKLKPNAWLEGLNMAISVAGLGVGLASLDSVVVFTTTTFTRIVALGALIGTFSAFAIAAFANVGINIMAIGPAIVSVIGSAFSAFTALASLVLGTMFNINASVIQAGLSFITTGAQAAAAWVVGLGPIAWVIATVVGVFTLIALNIDYVQGLWGKFISWFSTSFPDFSKLLEPFTSAITWALEKIKELTSFGGGIVDKLFGKDSTDQVAPPVLAQQVFTPISAPSQVLLPKTPTSIINKASVAPKSIPQIAPNLAKVATVVNTPNKEDLVTNGNKITFNTSMFGNSSHGAKGSSSTSNTNSTHHHQNVYNIANIDIADGMISDLEDLIQAINRHAC